MEILNSDVATLKNELREKALHCENIIKEKEISLVNSHAQLINDNKKEVEKVNCLIDVLNIKIGKLQKVIAELRKGIRIYYSFTFFFYNFILYFLIIIALLLKSLIALIEKKDAAAADAEFKRRYNMELLIMGKFQSLLIIIIFFYYLNLFIIFIITNQKINIKPLQEVKMMK